MSSEPEIRISEPICAVFRRQLRHEGLKYTPERARILDVVLGMHGPFVTDRLIAVLKERAGAGAIEARVSKATVYRTIKLLQDAGIIQQVLFNADVAHYQLAYGEQPVGVLVNTDTNEITQFDAPELIEIARRQCAQRGLVLHGQRLVVYASKA
jgi:Fur family ferric uptake transcriptional regulator